jgi:hypothetical protein
MGQALGTLAFCFTMVAPAAGAWAAFDLTAIAGAPPAASAPMGYTTDLVG